MTNEYKKILCDIDFIIENLSDKEKNKIPLKLRNMINKNKLADYKSEIKPDIPLEEQKLHPDTQAFLALLYLNYWCKDDEEKKELKKILSENENKYQKELSDKYDVYKIFKDRQEKAIENNEEETQIIVYKESIIKRVLNKIFSFFKKG